MEPMVTVRQEKKLSIWQRINSMFIKKKYLQSFLAKKNLDIVWTVLGEKQKITENGDLPGSAEFSYTYSVDDTEELWRNHEVYETREPIYR